MIIQQKLSASNEFREVKSSISLDGLKFERLKNFHRDVVDESDPVRGPDDGARLLALYYGANYPLAPLFEVEDANEVELRSNWRVVLPVSPDGETRSAGDHRHECAFAVGSENDGFDFINQIHCAAPCLGVEIIHLLHH